MPFLVGCDFFHICCVFQSHLFLSYVFMLKLPTAHDVSKIVCIVVAILKLFVSFQGLYLKKIFKWESERFMSKYF